MSSSRVRMVDLTDRSFKLEIEVCKCLRVCIKTMLCFALMIDGSIYTSQVLLTTSTKSFIYQENNALPYLALVGKGKQILGLGSIHAKKKVGFQLRMCLGKTVLGQWVG